MIEDSNPTPQKDQLAAGAEKALARALEDLVSNASFRKNALQDQAGGFTSPGAGPCPDVGDWLRLANHGLPGGDLHGSKLTLAKRQNLLAHAALCTGCLNRLRESQRVLLEETTPEEQASLQELTSATPQWQHRLAAELAQTPHRTGRVQHPARFAWAVGAGLAAALVLSLIGMLWWRNTSAPERLLAEAYTQSRTSALRIPGAAFALVKPENHLRGSTTNREPAPLLSARATIERKLEKTPSDPHWLQMQARADMLEEHYDPAIDVFDRLLAAGPVTASLLLDDGMAYYLRGTATGSENDRATALDNLRRADELAPSDPVILFNEAIVMEDRGLVMNAVETWNRFLKFERDAKWQEEGRQRLQALEAKLSQVKTHESRMEQQLATPQAMRALAADPVTLAGIDEEFSTTLLPRLLDAAYPLPGDRSRGSPCDDTCAAARALLDALAASLQRNHQDSWLHEFLPSVSSPIPTQYLSAARALGQAIDADTRGDYAAAQTAALQSRDLFRKLGNVAGAERAEVERAYALQRSYTFAKCHDAIQSLGAARRGFAWIEAQAVALDAQCDVESGAASSENPGYQRAMQMALTHHYVLLELRARNAIASAAVESGDTETAWRLCMVPLRRFYEGDYPPFRAGTTMAGLKTIENSTPRIHLDLLLNRETLGLFALSQNRTLIAEARDDLVRAAIRARCFDEAQSQLELAKKTLDIDHGEKELVGIQAETEILTAEQNLDQGNLPGANTMLGRALMHMIGEDNPVQMRSYAAARGELEVALKHPETADAILGPAIVREELEARGAGAQNIVFAHKDRELYAALAGVWRQEGRPDLEILALWERYRLRILGLPVPACADGRLDCLKTRVANVFDRWRESKARKSLVGQIVLRDRVLLYRFDGDRLTWSDQVTHRDEVLSDAASLERVASSPATSQVSVDQAAKRLGDLLFAGPDTPPAGSLAIESDPLLGNLPWAAVETTEGPLGLHLDLEESPSILLDRDNTRKECKKLVATRPLIVGASVTADGSPLLPEALEEARRVAGDSPNSNLLLGNEATEARVAALMRSASIVHFAGHAAQYEGATRLLLAPSETDKPYLDSALLRKAPPKAARLVVFSACSSGKREEGWDHGMGDIVDTLASLGVPEVVATRWQIDSASAVPLMDVFYRGLANGLTVPQALTAARQSLARDARYRHPYYWAAYYASGVGTTDLREVFHGSSNEHSGSGFTIGCSF